MHEDDGVLIRGYFTFASKPPQMAYLTGYGPNIYSFWQERKGYLYRIYKKRFNCVLFANAKTTEKIICARSVHFKSDMRAHHCRFVFAINVHMEPTFIFICT